MLRVGSFFAWIDRQDVRTTQTTPAGTHLVLRVRTDSRRSRSGRSRREAVPTALPELRPETPAHGVTVAAKARIQLFSVTGIKYLFYCACAHIFHLGRCRS
jgi:hypothetical protein